MEIEFADALDSGQVNVDLAVSLASRACGTEQRAKNGPQSPERVMDHQGSRRPGRGPFSGKVRVRQRLRPREMCVSPFEDCSGGQAPGNPREY